MLYSSRTDRPHLGPILTTPLNTLPPIPDKDLYPASNMTMFTVLGGDGVLQLGLQATRELYLYWAVNVSSPGDPVSLATHVVKEPERDDDYVAEWIVYVEPLGVFVGYLQNTTSQKWVLATINVTSMELSGLLPPPFPYPLVPSAAFVKPNSAELYILSQDVLFVYDASSHTLTSTTPLDAGNLIFTAGVAPAPPQRAGLPKAAT